MNNSPNKEIPWELIAESLTGNLSVEGELQLQEWISADPENGKKFLQIKDLWKNGMEDYRFYKLADADESWKALQVRMRTKHPQQEKSMIREQFGQRRKVRRNLFAIAAVFIGMVGLGLWFILPKNLPVIFETAFNIQKRVSLPDGSVITLQPNSRIVLPADYNRSGRTIIMEAGEARFDVIHDAGNSFTVELGSTQIADIGTIFIIRKKTDRIDVSVSTGKIAFIKLSTRETKEVKAGTAITYDLQSESFGKMRVVDSTMLSAGLMIFENTPMPEVINKIQDVYGRKIISNEDIANQNFTGQFEGMSFENVIKVICATNGLDYEINDSICILKLKRVEQP